MRKVTVFILTLKHLPVFCMKLPFFSLSFLSLFGSIFAVGIMSSCNSTGGGVADTGYGPFDSRGNYVEAWADNPSKWNRRSSFKDSSPVEDLSSELLASNDSPPSNVTPISTSTSSRQVEVASLKKSVTPPKTTVKSSTTPKSTTSVAKTSNKTKAVATKPSSTRVVVKKGDTLSALALRYRSSVSSIQRANGMRDTKLAIGRSLVIPRL